MTIEALIQQSGQSIEQLRLLNPLPTSEPTIEEHAQAAAEAAQEIIGEAYRSPHTRQTALEAARIALGIKSIQPEIQGEQ